MKYHIVARVLGPYLPKRLSINDCKIVKKPFYDCLDYPTLPVRESEMEKFLIKKGVLNYIQYPQKPISTRNFQSEYLITIDIKGTNLYHVVEKAAKKIEEILVTFSLASQSKKRTRGFYGNYYYEIIGIYIKRKKMWIRVKLPAPLINGHNFFPKPLPQGITKKIKGFLGCNDPIFLKGLEYLKRANRFIDFEYYSELEIVMNLVKCIELISKEVYKVKKVFDKKQNRYRTPHTSEIIEGAGKLLKIKKKNIKYAVEGWGARNKADVAHESKYFLVITPINISLLSAVAYNYLIKYFEHIKTRYCPI